MQKSQIDLKNVQADMAARTLEVEEMASSIIDLEGLNKSMEEELKHVNRMLENSLSDRWQIQEHCQALEKQIDQQQVSIRNLETQVTLPEVRGGLVAILVSLSMPNPGLAKMPICKCHKCNQYLPKPSF